MFSGESLDIPVIDQKRKILAASTPLEIAVEGVIKRANSKFD